MMAAAESILQIRPGLKPYDDDLQYLKLLTGTGMESVLDDLESAPATGQEHSPSRGIIRALAAFRCGELKASGEWAASIDPAGLPTGQRAVLAGLLAETGRQIEALRIVEKISGATLTPDEFRFYRMALR
jgi:hypothetical protein